MGWYEIGGTEKKHLKKTEVTCKVRLSQELLACHTGFTAGCSKKFKNWGRWNKSTLSIYTRSTSESANFN